MVFDDMIQGNPRCRHPWHRARHRHRFRTDPSHYSYWRDLDYAVRFGGLTPAQALNAATRINARSLGLSEETGSLDVGKAADLVVVDSTYWRTSAHSTSPGWWRSTPS